MTISMAENIDESSYRTDRINPRVQEPRASCHCVQVGPETRRSIGQTRQKMILLSIFLLISSINIYKFLTSEMTQDMSCFMKKISIFC